MKHQDFSQLLTQAMAEIASSNPDCTVENVIGGTALTLGLMMRDSECEEISVGPLTLTLTETE